MTLVGGWSTNQEPNQAVGCGNFQKQLLLLCPEVVVYQLLMENIQNQSKSTVAFVVVTQEIPQGQQPVGIEETWGSVILGHI